MPVMQVTFLETPMTGKRVRFSTQNNLNGVTSPLTSVNVDNLGTYKVSTQSGSVYVGSLIGTVKTPQQPVPQSNVVSQVIDLSTGATVPSGSSGLKTVPIDINHLNELESFLLEIESTKLTEAQIMALIKQKDINVEEHAAFWQVWNAPNRDYLIVCSHSSHNTPQKQDECLRSQAAKLAVRTVRHYLGLLERHQDWQRQDRINGTQSFVIWSCIERAGHRACDVCREREGMIEAVGATRIEIPHPNCHCCLDFLSREAGGDQVLLKKYGYLKEIDPARAAQLEANIQRSGWRWSAATEQAANNATSRSAKGSGCCVLAIAILLLPVFLLFLLK